MISVILPTYNEKDSIIDLIEKIKRISSANEIDCEIIVVDDDSPDGTSQLVRKNFTGNNKVKLIVREKERGLATAIKTGLLKACGEIVVLMDTDFNHDPHDIPRLLVHCKDFDFVVGSRYVPGGGMLTSKFRFIASYLFNLFIRVILLVPIKDNLSGFLVFRKEIIKEFDLDKIFYGYGDYCIRLLYLARKKGFKIKEVPVIYKFRHGGESKTRFTKHFAEYILTVLRLRVLKI